MLVENQKVEVRWNGNNRKWYEGKGYKYTKHNDVFIVNANDLKPTSKTKVSVICDYCNEMYETFYRDYVKGLKMINKSCCCKKECRSKKSSDIQLFKYKNVQYNKFVNLCKTRGYIPISKIDDYKGSRSKLKYKCPKHGEKETTLSNFERNKAGCNECGNMLISMSNRESIEHYINILNEKDISILNPNEYVNMKTSNLKVVCKSCKKILINNMSNLLRWDGYCRNCSYDIISQKNMMPIEDVVSIISSKNNNILINPNDYTGANDPNLKIKCGSCGNIFVQSLSNYNRSNLTGKCPDCNVVSYGEYLISDFLWKNKIKYTRQEHFNGLCRDVNPMPFDFYLPDYNTCIEFDGQGHYQPRWSEDSFYKTVLHDGMKNNYCKWNDIKLIRIPYWKGNNIEDILIKELNLKPINKNIKIKYIPNRKIA